MSTVKHVAVIPDGNRRWAKAHSMNPWDGHAEGAKRFWDIADRAYETGVTHLTFWAASYDNLTKRTKIEVSFLLKLLGEELQKPEVLTRCIKNKVRFQVFGEWRTVIQNREIAAAIEHLENNTQQFTDKFLTLLFVYDGQREMLSAVNRLMETKLPVDDVQLRGALWTGLLPDVDLVIRTGGEPHWSAGFMMWHTANSQFVFTETLWPDFDELQFDNAVADFEGRQRRKGK